MKPAIDPREKIVGADLPVEPGYEAWKRAKIERGLAQAQDRASMIPAEQVLRDLGLEDAAAGVGHSPISTNL